MRDRGCHVKCQFQHDSERHRRKVTEQENRTEAGVRKKRKPIRHCGIWSGIFQQVSKATFGLTAVHNPPQERYGHIDLTPHPRTQKSPFVRSRKLEAVNVVSSSQSVRGGEKRRFCSHRSVIGHPERRARKAPE